MIDDIWVEISFDGGEYRVDPDSLDRLPALFLEELEKQLSDVAAKMLSNLRALYERIVRERPRNEGEGLRKVIMTCMQSYIDKHADTIDLGVFDLEAARRKTHNEQFGTETQPRSLFEILEEGYGPNDEYGWCPKPLAIDLAWGCINQLHIPDDQGMALLEHVDRAFNGRHGDGIMVKLGEPLFYKWPQFGTPLEHGILPHGGWEGWHVFGNTGYNPLTGEIHWMKEAVRQAMKKAITRLTTI